MRRIGWLVSGIMIVTGALAAPAFALTISPVKLEVAGDPGQTLTGQMQLYNEEKETKTYYSSIQNFDARGESGAPYFLQDRVGLATWIEVQSQVTLAPEERIAIPYTIRIPASVEPGGHFAAIFWGTSPPLIEQDGQVSIGGRLGMLVLLTVNGEMKEGGGLIEFGIVGNYRVVSHLPVPFFYRLGNDGSTRVKPDGEIVVKNLFGGVVAAMNANRRDGNVLPGSVRKFVQSWVKKGQEAPLVTDEQAIENEQQQGEVGFFEAIGVQWREFGIGMYTADLSLTYGSDKTAESSYRFFLIPWQLLSAVFGGLLIIWLILRAVLHSYAQAIVRQVEAGKYQHKAKTKKSKPLDEQP